MLLQMTESLSFLWMNNISLYIHTTRSVIYSSVDGHVIYNSQNMGVNLVTTILTLKITV